MNFASKSRKVLTSTVVAATIAWSMGLSALTASAATVQSGSLIKASLTTVYYLGADNKRYVFPNQDTYMTWYADFSGVQTITDAELAALPLGGNVTFRPGVKMIKITTDPKVYAVSKGGVLRWIKTEAAAQALYGSQWSKSVKDVSDAFFTNYTMGADIASSADYSPATEMANSGSINIDKNMTAGGSNPVVISGSLTAMLSASQPMGRTIPGKATGVAMVNVDVRNSGSVAVSLDTMTIRRTGVGATSDFKYVYLYDGNVRLTSGRTINSSTNEASFGGLNLSIAAGETKTLTVSADMNAGLAGNTNSIQVITVTAGSVAAAGLPVTGPTFTLAGATVGQVTISANGGTLPDVDAGTTAKVGQFLISASGSEDVVINKVALYFDGSTGRENVTNLTLKQAGNTLATATGISSKNLVTFVLNSPMSMAKGNSRVFEVYADISGNARAAETVGFHLDNGSDLYAVGSTYGAGVEVINTAYSTASYTVAIKSGAINITYNGPAAKNVAIDGKDVELLNITLAAQSNVEVKKLHITLAADHSGATITGHDDGLIDTSAGVANYTDIKIVDVATGATLGSVDLSMASGYSDTNQALVFQDSFNIAAGQARTIKLTVDIANNAALATGTADTITGALTAFLVSDIRNLDNNQDVATTDIVPNSGISGNPNTLLASTVGVSTASTPVKQTYIKGTQGVELGGIIVKAGDAGAMKVSSITLTPNITSSPYFTAATTAAADYDSAISTASLWNGATQLGSNKAPNSSTGVLVFDNLNLTVPAGQSITVMLKGNLSSIAANGSVRYSLAADTDISVTDVDGSSKAATGAPALFKEMIIAAQGTVSVALAADDTDSEAGLVLGGGSNVILAKYRFNASAEELKLSKVQLHVATASAVSSVSLYDGANLVGGPTAVDGSGNADFSGMNFVIPKDGNKVLVVKANLSAVGIGGSPSGASVQVVLKSDAGTLEIRGTSAGSSTLITSIGGSVTANDKIVRASKPTVSLEALPSSTLTTGDIVIARFKVSADASGDVALARISANVTNGIDASSVTFTGEKIRRVGGSDIIGTVASAAGSGKIVINFTNEEIVPAGQYKIYDIIVNLATSPNLASGDTLSTKILGDADLVTDIASASVVGNFVWSDGTAASHSLASADWNTGHYVKTIPADTQTLSK